MIPALNEQETIGRVVEQIPRQIIGFDEVEIIVMDDDSTDATAARATAAGATVFTLRGRPGLGHVFRIGMAHAIRRGADVIVNIDGDGQFDGGDVPRLIAPIAAGDADFITCSRFGNTNRPVGMSPVKYWGNRAVTWLVNRLARLQLSDVSCGFRAYNRQAAYRVFQFGRWSYTEESVIDLASKGLRIAELPLDVRGEREHGTSRVVPSVVRFGAQLACILALVVRDKHALSFFGLLAVSLGTLGLCVVAFCLIWLAVDGDAIPVTSVVHIGSAIAVATGLLFVLAQLADQIGQHRKLDEELLYLARRRAVRSTFPAKKSMTPATAPAPPSDFTSVEVRPEESSVLLSRPGARQP